MKNGFKLLFIVTFFIFKNLNSMDENTVVIRIRHDQVMDILTNSVRIIGQMNRSADKINRCINITACLCTAFGLITTGILLSLKYCHS